MISPELATAIGGACAAVIAAAVGGNAGGKNSLNGFKEEVRTNFTGIHSKLDTLTKTDGEHEARLKAVETLAERRLREEPVVSERRSA